MPNQQVQHPASVPTPTTITPALLKTHSITPDEYTRIEAALGRTPSLTELGIFRVMWSEHCSYKSSRVHLKRLPTRGDRKTGPGSVVQGPGENAGIIDVGDGWACAFKIEIAQSSQLHRAVPGRGGFHWRRRNSARHLHHECAAAGSDGLAALRAAGRGRAGRGSAGKEPPHREWRGCMAWLATATALGC